MFEMGEKYYTIEALQELRRPQKSRRVASAEEIVEESEDGNVSS
jgi:hypothetical protein